MTNQVDDPLRPLADILKADDRQGNLPFRLEDVHAMLSAMTLHAQVPDGVRQLFETAKNIRLYTYFVYRFHQVAEMAAYQTLEMSLLLRWRSEHPEVAGEECRRLPTLGQLLQEAGARQWIWNGGFSGRRWRAERIILDERGVEAMRAHMAGSTDPIQFNDPTPEEVEARMVTVDVVSALVKSVPKMRNTLAHGSTKLVPMSDYVLQDVCDAVNMIFQSTARDRG
jgi:hypothetical protein